MKIGYLEERALVSGLLTAAGMSEEDADIASEVVAYSDFSGVYSHGLSRLTFYLKQLANGAMNAKAKCRRLDSGGAVSTFDCENGSGIVSVRKVYDELLPKVREYGIAAATGRRSANIGCGAYYGQKAAQDGLIMLLCCNTYPLMAPYGGADCIIGSNPIIISAPTARHAPVVLDISTCVAAMGKITAAKREGRPIPEGWAKDAEGNPTTDPNRFHTVVPIAGHKGYGLAVMVDVMSAVLSGAAYGTNIGSLERLEPESTGFFMLLVDPSRFMPLDEFLGRMDDYIDMLKSGKRQPGVEEIFVPGEIEARKQEDNMESGIELSASLMEELRL